ncbi:uncharacterized protein LOC116306397 [Actinia tenebrosa]|uniref:Uncharacterized protein LOC116306397 n=1 Tax=Actinia tenebrosa TaxID=6105 RepID=A0A6P8IYQ8_ACTTE|nr:uncharacterized protein LOC116306397 [Actinia tenebrosa]
MQSTQNSNYINARNWLPEQKNYDIGSSITLICKPRFKPESKSSVMCNSLHASFCHLPSCKDMDECVVGVQDINSANCIAHVITMLNVATPLVHINECIDR